MVGDSPSKIDEIERILKVTFAKDMFLDTRTYPEIELTSVLDIKMLF